MARPDFLIIGAMKCGTSTLAAQLAHQAGVFLSTPKEPNFFSDDAVFAKGLPWYEALFDAAAAADLKGEASTHYTKLPTYPETVRRVADALSAPRLIYMVRDPVERAVSHFIHEWTERRMHGVFEEAVETHPELIDYGLYAKQIAPFVAAFGSDAICLTSLERLKADPQGELVRVARHIGMVAAPVWHNDLTRQNVSEERLRRLPFHALLVRNPVSRAVRRTLVPKSVRARLAQARRFGDRPVLSDRTEADLRHRFAADQADLAQLFPGILETRTPKDMA